MSDGRKYTDKVYDTIEAGLERKYNLPVGGMKAIRTRGERSNADQVSPKGAATVYQIIPSTRRLFKNRYGVDAYTSKEAAAEVAALHLRDSMRRNNGDWTKAVAEYNGGTDQRNWNNSETRNYVSRVTGSALPQGATRDKDGKVILDPTIDMSQYDYDELKTLTPNEILDMRNSPRAKEPREPKVSKEQRIQQRLLDGKSLQEQRGGTVLDVREDVAEQKVTQREEAERASYTFTDRLSASVDKNWVLNQIVRGLDREAYPEDKNFHKEYMNNLEAMEGWTDSFDDRMRLRQANSLDEWGAVKQQILEERERDKIINSNGTGLAFDLGTAVADPVGWVATYGVGKLFQLGKVAQGVRTMAAEGAVTGLGFTAAIDFADDNQSFYDYAASAVIGAGMGAALSRFMRPSGAVDTSADDVAAAMAVKVRDDTNALVEEAKAKVGPDASEDTVLAEVKNLQDLRIKDQLEVSLADVGEENKFLTADEDAILLGDKKDRTAYINKSGLDGIDDAGERAIVAEITARAEQIVKNNPIDEAGLQGRLLKAVGQESTGLTMLRSKSPVMRALGLQLLEGTTGAGGRRRSAAMSQVVRERLYMRPMVEYESLFHQWRKGEGIGYTEAFLNPEIRGRFDREVFYEVIQREGRQKGWKASSNPAVARAADGWEDGMGLMAREQKHVGTLGANRLPENSVGYMRHVLDPRKIAHMFAKDNPTGLAERRTVEGILAKQFNSMNEYSYIDKATGEKIVKNFDPKFSRKLAKHYLESAWRRGNGAYDVPVNLHDSSAADIIEDALEAMKGLDGVEREAILGKFSRGGAGYTKGRLKIDLNASIGEGRKLGDLFRQDISGLYRSYARRASGEVALAQYGIFGSKGLKIMRQAAEYSGATKAELEALEQVAAEFLNQPFGKAVRLPSLDNLRIMTSAARLGGMGFTQVAEFGNGLAVLGVARVMSTIKSMPRMVKEVRALARGETVENPILDSIDTLGGHLGMDTYQMTRMFDLPDTEVQLYNDVNVGLFGRAVRAGSHMTAVMSGQRLIVSIQTRGMAEQIARKAIRYIREGKESKALLDMGFTPEVQASIRNNMDSIAKFDSKGELIELNLLAATEVDPSHIMAFRDSVERGAGQIIQRTYIGETGAWAHNDLLKSLLQFRTFSITSIEKQWGRNQKNYGALRSAVTLIGAMSFALPIHFARMNAQMLGMSEDKREEFMEKRMSGVALARATLNYASAAGLLGDFLDLSTAALAGSGLVDESVADALTGGGQGRQSTSGLVPSLGMADDILKGTVGGQYSKLVKLLPGSNLPYVGPIINGLTQE